MDKHGVNPHFSHTAATLEVARQFAFPIPLLMADTTQSQILMKQISKASQCDCILLPPSLGYSRPPLVEADVMIVDLLVLHGSGDYEIVVERIKASGVKIVMLNVPAGLMGKLGENVITLQSECSVQEIVNALVRLKPELGVIGESPAAEVKELLTYSEIRVLRCLGRGMKNEDIADEICISPHTVKTHLYHSYQKIGCRNRAEAAIWAERHLGD